MTVRGGGPAGIDSGHDGSGPRPNSSGTRGFRSDGTFRNTATSTTTSHSQPSSQHHQSHASQIREPPPSSPAQSSRRPLRGATMVSPREGVAFQAPSSGQQAPARSLRFHEFACLVDVSFWQWVITQKLNNWKLSCPALKLTAGLEPSPTPSARPILRVDAMSPHGDESPHTPRFLETSNRLSGLPTPVAARSTSAQPSSSVLAPSEGIVHGAEVADAIGPAVNGRPLLGPGGVRGNLSGFQVEGTFYHVNTLEDFYCFPFTECVAATLTRTLQFCDETKTRAERQAQTPMASRKLRSAAILSNLKQDHVSFNTSIEWGSAITSVLNGFFIVAYMDLKTYAVTYVVCCPALGYRACPQQLSSRVSLRSALPPSAASRSSSSKHRARSLPPMKRSDNRPTPASPTVQAGGGPTNASSSSSSATQATSGSATLTKYDKYVCTESPCVATQEFRPIDISHIGRHLTDACCCHNSSIDRQSTGSVCLVVKQLAGGVSRHASCGISFVSLSRITPAVLELLTTPRAASDVSVFLAFLDFSKSAVALSWQSRNLLYAMCQVANLAGTELQLLAFRDFNLLTTTDPGSVSLHSASLATVIQSRIFRVRTPSPPPNEQDRKVLFAGWLLRKRTQPDAASAQNQDWNNVSLQLRLDLARLPIPPQGVFTLNLQSFLDQKVVQQDATELNVKLIKWRILPTFKPDNLQKLRFLIIGMGTLGCHIARDLVGWGVTKFTLLDSGVVSPSNPARQSLYLARDVEPPNGNKKVLLAKERLLEIRGDLQIDTLELEVPMPSQERFLLPVSEFTRGVTSPSNKSYAAWMHDKLKDLIESHDVILLLTDSRESRWLPSLIAQSMSYRQAQDRGPDKVSVRDRLAEPFRPPLCVTVALGFDTFVVIRHGSYVDCALPSSARVPADDDAGHGFFKRACCLRSRLSCYFCNDLTAPSSFGSRLRTLDQQCTVTRTGVASIAASVAIELIASMSQARFGFGAMPAERRKEVIRKVRARSDFPRDVVDSIVKSVTDEGHISCLGDCPHVTRGSVADFNLVSDWHPAFERCVCCGVAVQAAYQAAGAQFVESVIKDASVLESVSGLVQLRDEQSVLTGDVLLLEDDDGVLWVGDNPPEEESGENSFESTDVAPVLQGGGKSAMPGNPATSPAAAPLMSAAKEVRAGDTT